MKKIILAYSGGLDTSCCIQWLKDHGFDVICFSANLGSEFAPNDLIRRARKTGASKVYIKDLRSEFARDYILPSLKANALYQGRYVLSTSLGRPLIAQHLVAIAHKERALFVAHGCTGKGNDQVRIDTTVKILDSHLKIIAPLRTWELTSRQSEIEYARKHRIPIAATKEKIYSIDKNIWGVSIESGNLEDLTNEPSEEAYIMTQKMQKTPAAPEYLEIVFRKGLPCGLNGKTMDLVALIEQLNRIGGRHAVGRTDLVEDRTVGIKSREVYEAPGAWLLIRAHQELESMVLDRETLQFKEQVGAKYAQLVYQGLWFTTLRRSLDAFITSTQKRVTGTVVLKVFKGTISVAKRISPFSLYKKNLATYGERDAFDRSDAEGFINIFSLPYRGV